MSRCAMTTIEWLTMRISFVRGTGGSFGLSRLSAPNRSSSVNSSRHSVDMYIGEFVSTFFVGVVCSSEVGISDRNVKGEVVCTFSDEAVEFEVRADLVQWYSSGRSVRFDERVGGGRRARQVARCIHSRDF
jgi:hypothetical protein